MTAAGRLRLHVMNPDAKHEKFHLEVSSKNPDSSVFFEFHW